MADAVADRLANTGLQDSEAHANLSREGQISLRALVTTRDAGIIIGKGGKNVADLREQTGVKAGVSKAVPGVVDRILTVTGHLEGLSKAFTLLATNLIENSTTTDDQVTSTTIATSSPTTIKLLISHSIMGSVIGKQGAKIKQIQDASGARMVAAKEMLPQSTERIVEVSGTPIAIGTAIKDIAMCLLSDQDRMLGTILYSPGIIAGQDGTTQPPHSYGGLSALNNAPPIGPYSTTQTSPRGGRRSTSFGNSTRGGYSPAPMAQDGAPRTGAPYANSDRRPPYGNRDYRGQAQQPGTGDPLKSRLIAGLEPDDPNLRTQNISFPADMIGCIIGRQGAKISEIRKLSGSRINISKEPNPETGERLFSIMGTTETNEKALFLLYSSLEAEKERRANDDRSAA